jgi:uncharacterized protein YndB with AHSA1/START domain
MKVIHHVVYISASRPPVFAALTTTDGLSGWWSTQVKAASDVGGIVDFRFVDDFNPDMEIVELRPPERLVWKCVGGHEPWADNTFRFELRKDDSGRTRLGFWQNYATELDDDAFGVYNYNWGYYLDSLRLLCETGTGKPFEPATR